MKAHIGVDLHSGLVHSLSATPANEADVNQTVKLLHGEEKAVYADAGDTGADKRAELKDREVTWRIAMKRGKLKAMADQNCRGLATKSDRDQENRSRFVSFKKTPDRSAVR